MTGVRVAAVIPALDERPRLRAAIGAAWAAGVDEVIVVDGGSSDGTAESVQAPARLVHAARGRARQLNAGWRQALSEIVVVVHADSLLPPGAADLIRGARASGAVGGAFHKRFDSRHPLLQGVRWRTRLWWTLGLSFGDQAQFARREVLESLGGFREDAEAEDMDLALRLRRHGRCVLLPAEVLTSARRLQTDGVLRTWAAWWRAGLRQWRASRAR